MPRPNTQMQSGEHWLDRASRFVREHIDKHPDSESQRVLHRLQGANTGEEAWMALDAFQEWARTRNLLGDK
jgi:hypothetical protein